VINNAGLIRKIYFPRLLIRSVPLEPDWLIFYWLFYVDRDNALLSDADDLGNIWLVPLIALLFLTGLGVGSLLAALAVAYRDVRHIVPFSGATLVLRHSGHLSGNDNFGTIPTVPEYESNDRHREWLSVDNFAPKPGFPRIVLAGAVGLLFCLAGVLYFSAKPGNLLTLFSNMSDLNVIQTD
jgi:hypothetical protein